MSNIQADLVEEVNQKWWGRRELHGGPYSPLHVEVHPDVLVVLEFMQRELPARELIGVAKAVANIAPVIWARFPDLEVYPAMLVGSGVLHPNATQASAGEFKEIKEPLTQ